MLRNVHVKNRNKQEISVVHKNVNITEIYHKNVKTIFYTNTL